MYCPKCGKLNKDSVKFCAHCGANLTSGASVDKEAVKGAVKDMVKEGIDTVVDKETPEKIKKSWKDFCLSEKMIAAGAAAAFTSFFLPWITSKYVPGAISGFTLARETSSWLYLLPLLAIASLVLVFLNHPKDSVSRALGTRWQIIIGTFFVAGGISDALTGGGFLELFGGGVGIGWWLMVLGGLAILIGGLRFQDELLKKED